MDASFYRSSDAAGPPLRVGLLLDALTLPRWTAEVVNHVLQCNFATFELLVLRDRSGLSARRDDSATDGLLFKLYRRWDRRNADPAIDPLAPVDCAPTLAHVKSMVVDPIVENSATRFPADAVERIRERGLDVLIRFGFGDLRGDILTAARHGVWSYHHGDNEHYRGGSPYFWEVLERNPVSGAVLQVLADDPARNRILYKGHFATRDGFSQTLNGVQPYLGATTFLIQKLRELHAHGWAYVEASASASPPYRGARALYSKPTNREMIRWLVPLLVGKSIRRVVRRPLVRHWRIAVRIGARPLPGSAATPDMSGFRWVESPRGSCYADPFVIEADGRHWVYFENFNYATRIGKISCAEIRDGALGEPLTALEGPAHLSYPCVFRDAGTWYMIPETVSSGAIRLYRCTRFPDQWQYECELFRGAAVDTSIWIEGGLYWFFTTMVEPRGNACQLWLYSAASLRSPWTPHPANPISTDVRYARGAGAVFRHDGKLFRPSQDDSGEYGRRLILNEIMVMDRREYRELPRVTVDPELIPGLAGTHTYSLAGSVELIDGKSRRPANKVL